MVSVAQRLSMIQEQNQNQSCFKVEIIKTKTNTQKKVLGLIPHKDTSCSMKLNMTLNGTKRKAVCFGYKIKGIKATTPKTILGFSPDKNGFSSKPPYPLTFTRITLQ
jgi:hypothetical protein